MKKFIVLILIVSVFACDDFLLTESPSDFTENSIFNNVDFAEKSVNSIYSRLVQPQGFSYYMFYYMFDNDIVFTSRINNGGNMSIAHFDHSAEASYHLSVWNNFYNGVELANICINKLPQSAIWNGNNADAAHDLYGQAVTLRAFLYHNLIHIWGDVPFITKPADGGDNFYVSKTDRDSIYEFLIQDLKDVEDMVPWMSQKGTAEEVNKAYVKGLRARMALSYAGYSLRNKTFETRRGRYWQEYYKIANQECKEIIESGQHQLNPSYENVFKTIHAAKQDNNYRESFAELAFGRTVSGTLGYWLGMSFSTGDPKYGMSSPVFFTSPQYYYTFDKKDTRRNVTTELYNYKGTGADLGKQMLLTTHYYHELSKWRKSWMQPGMGGGEGQSQATGINLPLMRYSDILLMYAETENELNGPTSEAKNALASVRKRAFPEEFWPEKVDHYVDSVAISKEAFFNAIVDERMWEFGGEMLRKRDLIRWNLFGQKIRKLKEEYAKIINNDPEYDYVPDYIFWKRNDDGETIEILNPDYDLPNTTIEGYTKTAWIPKMSASAKNTTLNTYVPLIANGYDESLNNHLHPISSIIISNSNGSLSNDQMPGW